MCLRDVLVCFVIGISSLQLSATDLVVAQMVEGILAKSDCNNVNTIAQSFVRQDRALTRSKALILDISNWECPDGQNCLEVLQKKERILRNELQMDRRTEALIDLGEQNVDAISLATNYIGFTKAKTAIACNVARFLHYDYITHPEAVKDYAAFYSFYGDLNRRWKAQEFEGIEEEPVVAEEPERSLEEATEVTPTRIVSSNPEIASLEQEIIKMKRDMRFRGWGFWLFLLGLLTLLFGLFRYRKIIRDTKAKVRKDLRRAIQKDFDIEKEVQLAIKKNALDQNTVHQLAQQSAKEEIDKQFKAGFGDQVNMVLEEKVAEKSNNIQQYFNNKIQELEANVAQKPKEEVSMKSGAINRDVIRVLVEEGIKSSVNSQKIESTIRLYERQTERDRKQIIENWIDAKLAQFKGGKGLDMASAGPENLNVDPTQGDQSLLEKFEAFKQNWHEIREADKTEMKNELQGLLSQSGTTPLDAEENVEEDAFKELLFQSEERVAQNLATTLDAWQSDQLQKMVHKEELQQFLSDVNAKAGGIDKERLIDEILDNMHGQLDDRFSAISQAQEALAKEMKSNSNPDQLLTQEKVIALEEQLNQWKKQVQSIQQELTALKGGKSTPPMAVPPIVESLEIPSLGDNDDPVEKISFKNNATLFAAVPSEEGLFFGRKIEARFIRRQTFYRINIIPGNTDQATYTLIDDPDTLAYAFNIPDSYIFPACNVIGNGPLRQETPMRIREGMLQRENNNWKIVKKAVIEL